MRTRLTLCFALAALSVLADSAFASGDDRLLYADSGRGRQARAAPPPHAAAYGVRRGDRLAPAYRHHSYVVNNWHAHRLHAPPRGHHWVSVGADYLLVAIATGIIVDAVISQHAAAAPAPIAVPAQPPAAAGVFYYFCDSAYAYYPYVRNCPEGWRVLPSTPPGPLR